MKKVTSFILTAALTLGILGGVGGTSNTAEAAAGGSVVDYLYNSGQDYSFKHRKQLAAQKGISPYSGTASQNIALLNALKGGGSAKVSTKAKAASAPKSGKTLTVKSTAYTAYCAGCSGVTATGINLRANPSKKVIAVDPRVIPLGSTVHVEGYGQAVAGDTGGAIKGNKIDVFIPSKSKALQYGVKTVKVTVVK